MEIKNLYDLLNVNLQMLYSVEQQLAVTLSMMAEQAESEGLKKFLTDYSGQAKNKEKKLEMIGDDMGVNLTGVPDQGMMYILEEGETVIQQTSEQELRETAILSTINRIEHYETASYENAINLARKAGENEVAKALEEDVLEEKENADKIMELSK